MGIVYDSLNSQVVLVDASVHVDTLVLTKEQRTDLEFT